MGIISQWWSGLFLVAQEASREMKLEPRSPLPVLSYNIRSPLPLNFAAVSVTCEYSVYKFGQQLDVYQNFAILKKELLLHQCQKLQCYFQSVRNKNVYHLAKFCRRSPLHLVTLHQCQAHDLLLFSSAQVLLGALILLFPQEIVDIYESSFLRKSISMA